MQERDPGHTTRQTGKPGAPGGKAAQTRLCGRRVTEPVLNTVLPVIEVGVLIHTSRAATETRAVFLEHRVLPT